MAEEIDIHAFAAVHADGALVVDVREPWEYGSGHVPGAQLIPLDTLPEQGHQLPVEEPIYVICASGKRSLTAAEWLVENGRIAVSVAGGTNGWMEAGHPTVQGHSRGSA